jgi:hypothetical protein
LSYKFESNNTKIGENIKLLEQNYLNLKSFFDSNNQILATNSKILKEILNLVTEKETEKETLANVVKEVGQFIAGLKSKKAWIALIIAGIATIAGAISAVVGGIESIKKITNSSQTTPSSKP